MSRSLVVRTRLLDCSQLASEIRLFDIEARLFGGRALSAERECRQGGNPEPDQL